jgi:hypothetical protein
VLLFSAAASFAEFGGGVHLRLTEIRRRPR